MNKRECTLHYFFVVYNFTVEWEYVCVCGDVALFCQVVTEIIAVPKVMADEEFVIEAFERVVQL